MAKILTTLGANNDGLYDRIRKLEAEVVKTGLEADFYIKEFKKVKSDTQEVKSDTKKIKSELEYFVIEKLTKYSFDQQESLAKMDHNQQEQFIRFYFRAYFGFLMRLRLFWL
ncbi:hypothetical protein V8E54_010823 [Elaphomyces granulatus]